MTFDAIIPIKKGSRYILMEWITPTKLCMTDDQVTQFDKWNRPEIGDVIMMVKVIDLGVSFSH